MAKLVSRMHGVHEAVGSSPTTPTTAEKVHACPAPEPSEWCGKVGSSSLLQRTLLTF